MIMISESKLNQIEECNWTPASLVDRNSSVLHKTRVSLDIRINSLCVYKLK